jgi:hypothetical protein
MTTTSRIVSGRRGSDGPFDAGSVMIARPVSACGMLPETGASSICAPSARTRPASCGDHAEDDVGRSDVAVAVQGAADRATSSWKDTGGMTLRFAHALTDPRTLPIRERIVDEDTFAWPLAAITSGWVRTSTPI